MKDWMVVADLTEAVPLGLPGMIAITGSGQPSWS